MTRSRVLRAAALPTAITLLASCGWLATGSAASGEPGRAQASVQLHGVSASSAADAWAVGFGQASGEATHAITRHWDGSRWRTVRSPRPAEYSFLWGVSDISATDAWAVGEMLGGATILPFAERWDGTAWQTVGIPDGPGIGKLTAVSGIDDADVWMVGTGYPGPRQTPRAFIEHWNGTRIKRERPAAISRGKTSELTAVKAVAADDVWAVGTHGRHAQTDHPLIEHYDGSSWAVVASAHEPGTTIALTGVDGLSSKDAWAVGWQATDATPTISALVQHWDGTHWVDSALVAPGYSSQLTSISAIAPDDVWAAGSWVRSAHDQRQLPLLEHWDGNSWSIASAPVRHGSSANLNAISMSDAAAGVSAGVQTAAGHATGYAVHWDGQAWSH